MSDEPEQLPEEGGDRGASLAFLALVAERELISAASDRAPDVPAKLQPRLGEYLLRNKVLSAEQLDYALTVQRQRASEGERRPLGQTLVDLEFVTREQLDTAILEQLIELQDALQASNEQLVERVEERTRQLQDALAQLSDLNQQKTNFVSNVSHELRTPLSHLRGYISLMQDGSLGPVNDDQKKAVDVSMRAIDRLSQLIEDLISFAESAKGELTLEIHPFDLKALVETLCGDTQSRATLAEVKVSTNIPSDLPLVYGDEEKVTWLLYQLVDNAIKFNRPAGTVLVGAKMVDNAVRVMVGDTGIGIPQDRIDEIFTPFHQLDGSSTRRHGGTGLGLSLARSIAQMHGTDLTVRSEMGKGTIFSFMLSTRASNAYSS